MTLREDRTCRDINTRENPMHVCVHVHTCAIVCMCCECGCPCACAIGSVRCKSNPLDGVCALGFRAHQVYPLGHGRLTPCGFNRLAIED